MEFEDLKMKCECNGSMGKITTQWKGIEVKGWRCSKCGEELIHPRDAQKALEIDKARERKELVVKLIKIIRRLVLNNFRKNSSTNSQIKYKIT